MNRRRFLQLFAATTASLAVRPALAFDTSAASTALAPWTPSLGTPTEQYFAIVAQHLSDYAHHLAWAAAMPARMLFGFEPTPESYYEHLMESWRHETALMNPRHTRIVDKGNRFLRHKQGEVYIEAVCNSATYQLTGEARARLPRPQDMREGR